MTVLESFKSGEHLKVDFASIERELKALWKQAAEQDGRTGQPAVTRACQQNLIVCCDGLDEALRATAAVADVTRSCPSRVLMAVVDPTAAEDRLQATITAHCGWSPGTSRSRQVCCEQISMVASGAGVGRLAGAVLPLVLGDLPVVLWCPGLTAAGVGPAAGIARRLMDEADRIVYDLRRFQDARRALGHLAALPRPAADMAWYRLRGWRELTAELFDRPAFEEYPGRVTRIRVEHRAGAGHGPGEAILLGCWAASRLGWRAADRPAEWDGTGDWPALVSSPMIRPQGGAGALELQVRAEDSRTGVLSLELEAPGAVFSARRADGECVTASVAMEGGGALPRTARVADRTDSALLCRSLEAGTRDPNYDEALRMAARLFATAPDSGQETPQ